jgi:hypothetical protein
MIKMQVILDDDKMRREKKVDATRAHQVVDEYLIGKLGLRKAEGPWQDRVWHGQTKCGTIRI